MIRPFSGDCPPDGLDLCRGSLWAMREIARKAQADRDLKPPRWRWRRANPAMVQLDFHRRLRRLLTWPRRIAQDEQAS